MQVSICSQYRGDECAGSRQLSGRDFYAITHSQEKWCIDADVKPLRQSSAKTPASQEAISGSLEELRGWDPGCTLSFSSFSSPISVLKDARARMHIVHPSFFILSSHLTPHTSHLTPPFYTTLFTPHISHLPPHTLRLQPAMKRLQPARKRLQPARKNLQPSTKQFLPIGKNWWSGSVD